jgi:hypothetical protein
MVKKAGGRRQEAGGKIFLVNFTFSYIFQFFLRLSTDVKVKVFDLPSASCLRPPAFDDSF